MLIYLIRVLHNRPKLGYFNVLMRFKEIGSIHGLVSQMRKLALQRLHHPCIALGMKRILAENTWRAVALQGLGSRTEAVTCDIAITAEDSVA